MFNTLWNNITETCNLNQILLKPSTTTKHRFKKKYFNRRCKILTKFHIKKQTNQNTQRFVKNNKPRNIINGIRLTKILNIQV